MKEQEKDLYKGLIKGLIDDYIEISQLSNQQILSRISGYFDISDRMSLNAIVRELDLIYYFHYRYHIIECAVIRNIEVNAILEDVDISLMKHIEKSFEQEDQLKDDHVLMRHKLYQVDYMEKAILVDLSDLVDLIKVFLKKVTMYHLNSKIEDKVILEALKIYNKQLENNMCSVFNRFMESQTP